MHLGHEHVAPVARQFDADSTFPWENVKKMGELGLLGVPWSEELGGAGLDIGSFVQGRGHFSLAILVPIRNADADNYIDDLKTNYGVNFNNNLLPITFSIGYKFVL